MATTTTRDDGFGVGGGARASERARERSGDVKLNELN